MLEPLLAPARLEAIVRLAGVGQLLLVAGHRRQRWYTVAR